MAQSDPTVKTLEAAPVTPKVSVALTFSRSRVQASVPPVMVPAVKAGVPTAMAVEEPSEPASSR